MSAAICRASPYPRRHPAGDRAELAALFAEPAAGRSVAASAWEFDAPRVPAGLHGLPEETHEIPGVTGSQGAHRRADPALSLIGPEDRARQVIRWLCQVADDPD